MVQCERPVVEGLEPGAPLSLSELDKGCLDCGPLMNRWLGQNSKEGKLKRQLTDIQIRMRLKVSGGKAEIREQYMPLLAAKIVLPLASKGAVSLDELIDAETTGRN